MPVPFDPSSDFTEYAHPERLVSASWLSAHLGSSGLRVVESDEDALLYDIGHIPGAMRIDWRKELNDPIKRDFIGAQEFAELMQRKGISREDTVVIYGDKSNWWAAFTFWIFELFGHPDVRLLNGGRDAWIAEERDTSFVVPEYARTTYPVTERNDTPIRAFVADTLDHIGAGTILDTRAPEEYSGLHSSLDGDTDLSCISRSGHIPTAVNVPWNKSVHANSRFRSRAELEEIYGHLDPTVSAITYCHVGDRSAHTWFVLKYLLGFDDVRNYDGSWLEWGNMVRMPIHVGTEAGNAP